MSNAKDVRLALHRVRPGTGAPYPGWEGADYGLRLVRCAGMATAGSCDADDFPVRGEVHPAEEKQRERELSEKILAYLCTAAAGALWIVGVFLGAYALFVGMVVGYPGQALALAGLAMLIILAAALVTDISTELREDVRWDEQLRVLREESARENFYRTLVEED